MQAPGTGLSELAARAADALGELAETVPRLSPAELDCLATYHPFATMEWLCALRDTCSGHLTEDVRLIDALEVRLGERDVEVASLRVQIAELRRALDGAQRSSWRFMEAAKRESPNPELVRSHRKSAREADLQTLFAQLDPSKSAHCPNMPVPATPRPTPESSLCTCIAAQAQADGPGQGQERGGRDTDCYRGLGLRHVRCAGRRHLRAKPRRLTTCLWSGSAVRLIS